MNLTICERMLQIAPAPLSVHPHSLYQALEQIKDGRKRRGKRYPLALIFTLLLLGKLAGETTILGVIEWVKWRQQWLKASCDAEELTRMLAAVLLKVRAEQKRDSGETETLRQVAVDGKTVRGTLSHRQEHQPAVHVVSWYEPESGLVLAHRAVEHKRHEISTLLPWLCPTLVKDRIITTDALHTQRAFCAEVIRFAGHSVLIAKKNQPTLWEALHTFFPDPQADEGEWEEAHTWSKGHGRLEERRIRTTTVLTPLFTRQWAGVEQAFAIRRRITHPLKCSQQVVYGITSLTPQQVSPARLLELLRTHWHIENRSHYRRDVTLGEDASQVP